MVVFDHGKRFDVGKVFAGTTNESRKELDALLAAGQAPVAEVKYLYATADQLQQPAFVRSTTIGLHFRGDRHSNIELYVCDLELCVCDLELCV